MTYPSLATPSHTAIDAVAYCADSSRITAAGTVADLHSVPSLTKPLFSSETGYKDRRLSNSLVSF